MRNYHWNDYDNSVAFDLINFYLDKADKKYYGLGASYNFGDFKTNLNYTYYDINTRSTFLEDVTTITVGLSYKKEF